MANGCEKHFSGLGLDLNAGEFDANSLRSFAERAEPVDASNAANRQKGNQP
jgi:hypothetical protein